MTASLKCTLKSQFECERLGSRCHFSTHIREQPPAVSHHRWISQAVGFSGVCEAADRIRPAYESIRMRRLWKPIRQSFTRGLGGQALQEVDDDSWLSPAFGVRGVTPSLQNPMCIAHHSQLDATGQDIQPINPHSLRYHIKSPHSSCLALLTCPHGLGSSLLVPCHSSPRPTSCHTQYPSTSLPSALSPRVQNPNLTT